jgi:hypothetical protein
LLMGAMSYTGCRAEPVEYSPIEQEREVVETIETPQEKVIEPNPRKKQTNKIIKKTIDKNNVYFVALSGTEGEEDEYSADALCSNDVIYSLLFLSEKLEIPEENVFSVVSGDNLGVWPYDITEDDDYEYKNVNEITERKADVVGRIGLEDIVSNIEQLYKEKERLYESLTLVSVVGHRDPDSVGKDENDKEKKAKISFYDELWGDGELQKVINSIKTEYNIIALESCLPEYSLKGDENTYIIFSAPPYMVSTKSPTHIFSYTKAAYPEMNIFDAYLAGEKQDSMLNQYVLTWRNNKPVLFDEELGIFNFEKTGEKVLIEYPKLVDKEKEIYENVSFYADELKRVYTGEKITDLPNF